MMPSGRPHICLTDSGVQVLGRRCASSVLCYRIHTRDVLDALNDVLLRRNDHLIGPEQRECRAVVRVHE